MKLKLQICTVMMVIPASLGLSVTTVWAKSAIVPDGPWLTETQNVSLQRHSSYLELVMQLQKIEKTSKGLESMLEQLGYHVYAASSGEMPLKIYAGHNGRADLILLDISMPNMDGKQCLAHLLNVDPAAKVVFASSQDMADEREELLSER